MNGPARRKVAVTGLGVLVPGASSVADYWRLLLAGVSVAAPLTGVNTRGLAVDFGCQVGGVGELLSAKERRRTDRFTQFTLVAAAQAVDDARLGPVDPERCGVVAGIGFGGLDTLSRSIPRLTSGAPVNPLAVPMVMPNAAPANVALRLGWTGAAYSVATACASSADAIGQGARLVATGELDVVLAGGAEAPLSPMVLTGFHLLRALSTRVDAPAQASRPFDRERDGFVMGEGAAFCVLEPLERALARGRRPYAMLAGYGHGTDAFHLVAPRPDGAGARACMERALDDAGTMPAEVVHVNAHGTSTAANDTAEALAVTAVFGPRQPPVTSVKGTIGHLIGGAGAAEFVASCLTLHHRTIPPTANFQQCEPEIKVDVVCGSPRLVEPGPILSNSFGFGGHNACLVVTPPPVG